MRENSLETPNFIDKSNKAFRGLHGTLDNLFHSFHESGIGQKVQHAEVISKEEENQLWETGQLGVTNPMLCFITMGRTFV